MISQRENDNKMASVINYDNLINAQKNKCSKSNCSKFIQLLIKCKKNPQNYLYGIKINYFVSLHRFHNLSS